MRRRAAASRSRGFTYAAALAALAIVSVASARLGEAWAQAAQREREAELLHIGAEYRRAIERYLRANPGRYPMRLEDLLQDPRHPGRMPYLRRLYADPVTGAAQWGLVRAFDGGIAGVHSLSQAEPLKRAGFRAPERAFEGAARYSDWRFIYPPR